MCDLKVGDLVVLNESTKPYKFKGRLSGEIKEKFNMPIDGLVYIIEEINGMNATIAGNGYSDVILKEHLKIARENLIEESENSKNNDRVELRLSIFNNNKSKSLEEMKAIEEWILGEAK